VRLFGPDPRVGAPVGAVVAVADLVDCHPAALTGRRDTCCAPWGERSYATASGVGRAIHLVFANIRALATPVHCAGKVLLPWELPDDIAAAVEREVASCSSS
jgi:hypothetical protein